MMGIKFIKNAVLGMLLILLFRFNDVYGQSCYTFPVYESAKENIKKVLIQEDKDLNRYIVDFDVIISVERDTVIQLLYVSRDNFLSFLRKNTATLDGIFIYRRMIAVGENAGIFFRLGNNMKYTLSCKKKEVLKEKNQGLIFFNEPTDYIKSKYLFKDGEFWLIDRNFIP